MNDYVINKETHIILETPDEWLRHKQGNAYNISMLNHDDLHIIAFHIEA